VNRISPWRFVVTFGVVSLLGDVVYQGGRSVTGPLLAHLGATALVVGLVTGVGEAAALVFRLVSGPLADRSSHYWAWAMTGYLITAVTIPLLGLAGSLTLAAALIMAERLGKAARSPAKDALLAHATAATGRGKGFAVHKVFDQFGAVVGPMAVALALTLSDGQYASALLWLVVPGALAVGGLGLLRLKAPKPELFELNVETSHPQPPQPARPAPLGAPPAERSNPPSSSTGSAPPVSRQFVALSLFAGVSVCGFATFGLIAFHLVDRGLLAANLVPVLYAVVMGVDAVVALGAGLAYDRLGSKVLVALPLLSAIVPLLAFGGSLWLVAVGAAAWGAAMALQEATLRATVADLITQPKSRATAYGRFAAVIGLATAIGGTLAGWLYQHSIPALIGVTVALQAVALAVLVSSQPGPWRRPKTEHKPAP